MNHQILRLITAGNVDDGKSSLIGRLLYDSKTYFEDQLSSIEQISLRKGHDYIDLAMFTDGLRDERMQGITIDVAYRYFTTPKRKFIIADTPGHLQYTRNMVTGASTANAAIILIDAQYGITEQTKRHSFIISLLHIPHLIVCVNKMDLVNYSSTVFEKIVNDFEKISSKLTIQDIQFIPISALKGDNVVERSTQMDWYLGAPLMTSLENLYIGSDQNNIDARFPIQTVIRPQREGYGDYRGYAGRIASGILRKGDEVKILPSGFQARISSIDTMNGSLDEAFAPMSVVIRLDKDIDISRGDMIVRQNNQPDVSQDIDIMVCWLGQQPMQIKKKYKVLHACNLQLAFIQEIIYKIDIETLDREMDAINLQMNDIGRIKIRTAKPLMVDPYSRNKLTGSMILIDPDTNETVAAGMVSQIT